MLAILLGILLSLLGMGNSEAQQSVVIPPVPNYAPDVNEEDEWREFYRESFTEHATAFDVYFASLEVKRAKNGAMMIRRPGDKSFKFARKA